MSANLHPIVTGDQPVVHSMPNIFHVLWQAVWGVVTSMLGIVGLQPIYLAYIVGAIVGGSLAFGIWGQMTGRVKFTLEPDFQKLNKDE